MANKKIFYIIISLAFVINVYGQVGIKKVAQSTMNFQLVSTSPKASGMGEAFTAVGTGVESIFYNPSALVEMDKTFSVSFSYTQWIADIKYLTGAAAWNLGNLGTVGLSLLTVDYGTIYATRLPANTADLKGYIDDGVLGNVGAYSFGLSYAKAINDKFSIGGNVRYVGQNLGTNIFSSTNTIDNNASKLAFDAGVKYYTGIESFRFGMAIRNFSTDIKRQEVAEVMPLTFTIGAAFDVMDIIMPDHNKDNSLTVAVDYLHSNSYNERVNLGVEYKMLGMVALRGGYQTNRDIASWSAGAGFTTSVDGYDAEVNYSYSYITEIAFKSVNRLSILFSF